MAPPSSIRKALGAVKDHTSIGLAKVGGGSAAISDLDVAIVKATRHDEHPAEEKHIREILGLTRYSRSHISACVATLSRRLGKTRSWAVALKSLVLVHRLLAEGDPAYEEEVFFATRRGTRLLDMSDFRDTSRSDPWDFSAFVRTYALYLDERLEYRMQGRRAHRGARPAAAVPSGGDQGEQEGAPPSSVRSTPVREMKPERVFSKAQRLQRLLERFLACRPTGAAKNSRIVALALYPLVKESHQLYFDISEALDVLLEQFMELDVPGCMKVHDFFSRVAKQFDELDIFYHWCRTSGVARASNFPEIQRITPEKLQVMEELTRDKSALVSGKLRHVDSIPDRPEEDTQQPAEGVPVEALPAPETEETKEESAEAEEVIPKDEAEAIVEVATGLPEAAAVEEEEVDFLNLRGDAVKPEDHGDQLALALFDGAVAADPSAPPKWEAFAVEAAALDWETALVQSASTLSGQKASLGGGFDQLLLDGMYQQPPPGGAVGGAGSFTGSASSMALPQGQQMLALPAPPSAGGGQGGGGGDPFAASLVVAPPSYVQMSEMEKKQHLLVEEQRMWQQYAKDGMQGHLGAAAAAQANPYVAGGCAPQGY
ncbi:hypothetical protein Taro_025636 [Colocasia esculenta]|uniref:ENTH domain-containing protein n=1 Tax=Colocasia esculenta TaxID=4460 RepID=A0A843VCT8_COLES|nr:hypothetical protein [Colocasia esculenta]